MISLSSLPSIMGILRATDDCLTACLLGVGGLALGTTLIAGGVALEIVGAPVFIPLRILRGKRVKEGIALFLESLSPEDQVLFKAEFGKQAADPFTLKDAQKYYKKYQEAFKHKKMRPVARERIMELLPKYCKTHITWVRVPSAAEVADDWTKFFIELKLQAEIVKAATQAAARPVSPLGKTSTIVHMEMVRDDEAGISPLLEKKGSSAPSTPHVTFL